MIESRVRVEVLASRRREAAPFSSRRRHGHQIHVEVEAAEEPAEQPDAREAGCLPPVGALTPLEYGSVRVPARRR